MCRKESAGFAAEIDNNCVRRWLDRFCRILEASKWRKLQRRKNKKQLPRNEIIYSTKGYQQAPVIFKSDKGEKVSDEVSSGNAEKVQVYENGIEPQLRQKI